MVARHVMIRAGFLREAEEMNMPRMDRELWERAYDMIQELGKACIR